MLSILFLSLSCIKISYIFSGVNINVTVVYISILVFYAALFIYLLLKNDVFTLYRSEPYLILSTAIGLDNNANPFCSIILNKLKSLYKLFIKDFAIDCVRLAIFVAIFFMSDEVIATIEPSNTVGYTILTGGSKFVDNIPKNQIAEKNYIDREIKKISDIKTIMTNNSKKENILKEIDNLQFIDKNEKSSLMGKVLDGKIKDVIEDLLRHTKDIKENVKISDRGSGVLKDIESELSALKTKVDGKKNNKKFKISTEYLRNWYGYEDVLKKYFNE